MKKNIIILSILILSIFCITKTTLAVSDGSIDSTVEINALTSNGPSLAVRELYGYSVVNIGDLDGDGTEDMVVGLLYDDTGSSNAGAVNIHFMNSNGSVKSTVEINDSTTNGPTLTTDDNYGTSVTNIGDLNNDGVNDIIVGTRGDDAGGTNRGAVHISFLNSNGSVKSTVEINDNTTNGPVLSDGDQYGISVANIGDLDGDGIEDIAVGAYTDDAGGTDRGAVHISFLNSNGSVKSTVEINDNTTNGPVLSDNSYYGVGVTGIGDLNNDGVEDIIVTACGGSDVAYIHFLNSNGSVKSTVEINETTLNGPLTNAFAWGVVNMGDLNNDGIVDVAMSTPYKGDNAGNLVGIVHICFLNANGSVKKTVSFDYSTTNGPSVSNRDYYGVSITNIGDLDNNGVNDIVVGAPQRDVGFDDAGAIHIHFLTNKAQTQTDTTTNIGTATATGNAEITDIGTENPTRLLQWGTVSGTYTNDCSAGVGGLGTYSCDLTNLDPDTTYYIRAKATNEKGDVFGQEQSFTTNPLTNQEIPNPDANQIDDLVTNGYITVNNGTIDNTTSISTNSAQIVFQSNTADAIFPSNTQITESASGSFNFENFITQNTLEQEQTNHPNAVGAVRLGVPNTNLSFSQDIDVEIEVSTAYNGMELEVLSKLENSSTYNNHATCTITNGICSFTTNHATTYVVNGDGTISGSEEIDINVNVQATLSLDCYDKAGTTGDFDVTLGTTLNPGIVTAGTPAVGQSTCNVTTNDDKGYFLTVVDDNGATNDVLTHTMPDNTTVSIQDTTGGLTAWVWSGSVESGTGSTKVKWDTATPTGLGFSVVTIPANETTNNNLNSDWTQTNSCPETSDTSNDYAAFPDAAQAITGVVTYQSSLTTTDICYKVDVPSSQPSGTYTGSVTYTATSDATSL
jgi:hypothetical protein